MDRACAGAGHDCCSGLASGNEQRAAMGAELDVGGVCCGGPSKDVDVSCCASEGKKQRDAAGGAGSGCCAPTTIDHHVATKPGAAAAVTCRGAEIEVSTVQRGKGKPTTACCGGDASSPIAAVPLATTEAGCCADEPEAEGKCEGEYAGDCCGPESAVDESTASTCGGGCCGNIAVEGDDARAARSAALAQDEGVGEMQKSKGDGCGAGCCDTRVERPTVRDIEMKGEADCCGGDEIDGCDDAKAGCCDKVKPGCCDAKAAPSTVKINEIESEAKDDCCDGGDSSSCNEEKAGCCNEIKPGCCDDSCVERLAERECKKSSDCGKRRSKSSATASSGPDDCCPNGISARQFYRDLLRSLGCLCQTVKSRGEPTCCKPPRRTSVDKTKATKSVVERQTAYERPGHRTTRMRKGKRTATSHEDHEFYHESSKAAIEHISTASDLPPLDLEMGNPKTTHVVLSVSGMTCSGCEVKLQRSLAAINSVRNLKTSLVLCRAEFDLDTRAESVAGMIQKMERMTGFRLEEINQKGAEIEVCPSDVKAFLAQPLRTGVAAVAAVDKTTVKMSFDPGAIGARDLVERGFDQPLKIAPVRPDPSLAAGGKHVRNTGYMTLLSAMLTIPVLVLAWAPLPERHVLYGSVSLALATLVQFIVAGPFYPAAFKALVFSRMIEMDLLICISTGVAYIYSVVAFGYMVAGQPLSTGEFFETSTLLVTLIMVGRWVSALARHKAVESVSVRSLQTPTAVIVDEQTAVQREIDARLLQHGDLFRVAPESHVPTDGTVQAGESEVDESMVTGEALPVSKKPGSVVIAGSINGSGVLTVRLTRLPSDNTISAIASMVDEAKLTKPKIQDIADRVASFFVPVAIAMGLIVFLIWIPIGLKVRGHGGSEATINALTYGITVIIVSCPCAIGLAVPMVIVIASGIAAKHGCIFKAATTIEIAKKTSHVVFDKTGTLTQGKLTVAKNRFFSDGSGLDETAVAVEILALLSDIKHPVAIAVKKHLEQETSIREVAHNVTSLPGKGVEGSVNNKLLKAGNSRWLSLGDHPDVQDYLARGYTTFCVTQDGKFVALFGLKDAIRSDTASAVAELQARGINISIVSGDDEGPVAALARQLNITSYKSRCTPADKKQFMLDINPTGKVTTIFCGDGTNDAVALAQATIGIHMNEGTDVAQSAADVILARSSLADIVTLMDLSKAVMRRITFNFAWAFTYNTFAILLASGALVNARIPPEYAGLGELVSVLPVIAIAMQLRWAKFSKSSAASE